MCIRKSVFVAVFSFGINSSCLSEKRTKSISSKISNSEISARNTVIFRSADDGKHANPIKTLFTRNGRLGQTLIFESAEARRIAKKLLADGNLRIDRINAAAIPSPNGKWECHLASANQILDLLGSLKDSGKQEINAQPPPVELSRTASTLH